jgi:hypothetical protein
MINHWIAGCDAVVLERLWAEGVAVNSALVLVSLVLLRQGGSGLQLNKRLNIHAKYTHECLSMRTEPD